MPPGVGAQSTTALVRKGLRVYRFVSIAYLLHRLATHILITSKIKEQKFKYQKMIVSNYY
jgi:hypothetical protein